MEESVRIAIALGHAALFSMAGLLALAAILDAGMRVARWLQLRQNSEQSGFPLESAGRGRLVHRYHPKQKHVRRSKTPPVEQAVPQKRPA